MYPQVIREDRLKCPTLQASIPQGEHPTVGTKEAEEIHNDSFLSARVGDGSNQQAIRVRPLPARMGRPYAAGAGAPGAAEATVAASRPMSPATPPRRRTQSRPGGGSMQPGSVLAACWLVLSVAVRGVYDAQPRPSVSPSKRWGAANDANVVPRGA